MTNLIGQSLGRYHILEQLGEGGMATVYKAFDTRLERNVAVKVILPQKQQSEKFLKRFEREAKALAQLSHPNIVKVLDYGEHEGMPYLVMEYLPGGTLKQKLGQPIPWQEAARSLAPITRALEYAHQQKIVHRDVKPSNILLTQSGEPMLSDFGVAKILEAEETVDLTGTGVGVGTPEYMAPEQGMGKVVDYRADIYALGVVFYELVTGRKPYRADTPMAVMLKKMTDPLPRPSQFVRDLPEAVENVLLKALARQPADRYLDMSLFAEALDKLAQGRLPKSIPSSLRPDHIPGKSLQWRWPLALGGIIIICLLTIVGGAVGLTRLVSSPNPKTQATQPAQSLLTTSTTTPISPSEIRVSSLTTTPLPAKTAAATLTTTPIVSSKDEMGLIYIPAGEFIMGSNRDEPYFWGAEAPKHNVYLDAFWIYRTEVTNKMYRACVQEKACPRPVQPRSYTRNDYYDNSQYDDYPVIYVTYHSALAYCQWIGGRLPTEAEWKKAARGTDGRLFPWGNGELKNNLANFCDTGCPSDEVETGLNDGYRDTAPAGSFPDGASPCGALDMAGNVLEWVGDWFQIEYYSSSPFENPLGLASGTRQGIRGGSWLSERSGLRPAARASLKPDNSLNILGFRCAIVAP